MIKAPLGYNTTNIIDINGMELPDEQTCFTLMNELEQLASVNRVGAGLGTPFNMGMNYTARYADGKKISYQMIRCDKPFADILGFQFLRDNQVTGTTRYFISESAHAGIGTADDAEKVDLSHWGTPPLAGIVKDFQLRNILQKNSPTIVILTEKAKDLDEKPWNILVEVNGDPVCRPSESGRYL